MFLYGCADNLKDTSQYSSVDNSNNSTDTGDNQGSGDNTGTDTGDNQGSGDNTGTDTGDNQGSGGNTDTENPDKKYIVTFHDNGAYPLYNSMPPLTECTSKGIEITENRFLKTGYKFVGWSTAPNDEMIYRNMQIIKCTDNVDLYALWEENPKDITGNIEKFRIFFNFLHCMLYKEELH